MSVIRGSVLVYKGLIVNIVGDQIQLSVVI
jgi:hypothetical protein